jgi:hypothetical protein
VVSESEKERIRLVQADLALTNDFIKGVLSTGAGLRGSAITIWLALVGFAIQQRLAELGLLAAIVAAIFLFVDGYHGWLYSEASKHARALERTLSIYYDALSRGDDDEQATLDFRTELRVRRFGLFISLKDKFSLLDIASARPHLAYRLLYPALIAIALAAWGLIGFDVVGSKEEKPQPTHVVVDRVPKEAPPGNCDHGRRSGGQPKMREGSDAHTFRPRREWKTPRRTARR